MKKSIIYALDCLDTPKAEIYLKQDIENNDISNIIIPIFVFKLAIQKHDNHIENILKNISNSSKVKIKEFPLIYTDDKKSYLSCFITFVTYISSEYKNIYIRTQNTNIILESLKLNYKIYLKSTFESIDTIMNNSTPTKSHSNIVYFDTSCLILMFESNVGLNILCDKRIRKIIFSANLEELIKLNKNDILDLLLFLIYNKKIYNIEFKITPQTYSDFYPNDMIMILYLLKLNKQKKYKDLVVYTFDNEFYGQCLVLGIKTDENKLRDIIEKKSNCFSVQYKHIPILIYNNLFYINAKDVVSVYKYYDKIMQSEIVEINSKKYYKIKTNYYIKLKNEEFLYFITKIDINKSISISKKSKHPA